jgi:neutral ceramidase
VGQLRVGIASAPAPAPVGADMVGFLRRHVPVQAQGEALEVTALVVEDGEHRVTLVGLDMLGISYAEGLRLREAIAAATDTPLHGVLVNCQHTHAAPPPPGIVKMGGLSHHLTPLEAAYWHGLAQSAVNVATRASHDMHPARLGASASTLDGLSVNRRERLPDGTTILGWNQDEECDRTVSTLRFEADDGTPLATLVHFACHPVVVGPDVSLASSDFVGPLREAVRQWTGADCIFLQGCAGNIMPLECFMERTGPERRFGRRLALAALSAWADADVVPRELVRTEYRSAVPIARYRWETVGAFSDRVSSAITDVRLPLDAPPTLPEISQLRADLEERARSLRQSGAGPEQWNPMEIHAVWAAAVEERVANGTVEHDVAAPVQVIALGPIAIVGLPGEPFNEIGSRIKRDSPAAFTICCGYSNAAPGYLPTSEEHAYGGYEVAINHRHYGNASPIAIGCDVLLQNAAAGLLQDLFGH